MLLLLLPLPPPTSTTAVRRMRQHLDASEGGDENAKKELANKALALEAHNMQLR